MTLNPASKPDPSLIEPAQAPPTHAYSNLRADEGVWAAARQSYGLG